MKRMNKKVEIDSAEVKSRDCKRKRRNRSIRKNKRKQRSDVDDKNKKIKTSTTESTDFSSVINHEDKEKKNQISINFAEIPSDIQFKILSCLPAKALSRFESVSKEFQSLIGLEYSRRQAANTIPFTGFFARNRDCVFGRGHKSSFISTAGGGLPDSSLRFLKQDRSNDKEKLIDSCNGLLLCEIINSNKSRLYVCNPLTKQKVFVPYPRVRGIGSPWSSYDCQFALIAQSTSMGYLRYKVVLIYEAGWRKKYSKMWMFSSETGEWEEFCYRLPSVIGDILDKRPRIFINGTTLIWDCFASAKYILVCYLNNKLASSSRGFDLIECPCDYQYMRSLWNYNGKILFYFNEVRVEKQMQEYGKLSAWSLCFCENNKIEWKKEDSLQLKTLAKDLWKYSSDEKYPGRELIHDIQIVGYDPSLKIMYISMGGLVVSYELVKRRCKLVWESRRGKRDPNVVFPYIHSLEHIENVTTNTAIATTVDDEIIYDDVDDGDDGDNYPICVEDDGLELYG